VLLKVARSYIHWWTSFSQTVLPAVCYLPFSRTFNCTSKTTGWFTKGLKLIRTTLTKCYSGSTRILIYIDGLLSVTKLAKPLLSYLLPFPERSIALVKRLAGSKGWNWSQPALNKVLLKVHSSYIHWWTSFSRANCAQAVAILPFFPERSIALVKRLAGSQGLKLIPTCPANKVLLRAFLYTLMDFFQSHQTVPNRCYLTFFHFPNVQLH
jgi:hypothetical protein